MVKRSKGMAWGLLLLRLGLGMFLVLWSIDKIISPQVSVELFSHYYFLSITSSLVMIIGSLELALSLFYIFGMYKTWTYGLALVIHSFATAARFNELLMPFGDNHLFISYLPLLCAFGSLFLMRHFDTQWSLGKKHHLFARN